MLPSEIVLPRCAGSLPPALPIAVNSSKGLLSSSKLTVTYIVPCPVRTRSVIPSTAAGRSRGTMKPFLSLSTSVSAASLPRLQHLHRLRAVTIDCDRFAVCLPCQIVGILDIFDGGAVGQVDGLGHGVGDVLLPRRLHPYMRLRADEHGGAEVRWVYAVLGEYAFRAVRVVGELLQHGAHLLFVRETFAQRPPRPTWAHLAAARLPHPRRRCPSTVRSTTMRWRSAARCPMSSRRDG